MNKQELINKAAEIRTPSANTANEFRKASPVIVAELNEIMRSRPDLEKLIGEAYGFQPTYRPAQLNA